MCWKLIVSNLFENRMPDEALVKVHYNYFRITIRGRKRARVRQSDILIYTQTPKQKWNKRTNETEKLRIVRLILLGFEMLAVDVSSKFIPYPYQQILKNFSVIKWAHAKYWLRNIFNHQNVRNYSHYKLHPHIALTIKIPLRKKETTE